MLSRSPVGVRITDDTHKKQNIIRLDARLQHAGMTTGEGVAGFVFLVFV